MKKRSKITSLAALLLISVSCTETVNKMDMDVNASTVLDTDTFTTLPVVVEQEDLPADSLAPGKYIYLTIDDAPLHGSDYIDSIVRKTQVKTNIFLVGNSIDGSRRFHAYYTRMKENPYIALYNHSYSHANHKYTRYYKNPEGVLLDFEKNRTDFNLPHKIARLPGRNLWLIGEKKKNHRQTGGTSADLLVQNGYQVFGWDVEWRYNAKDYTPKQTIDELVDAVEKICRSPLTFTENHIVLLMHVQMFAKANEHNDLEKLIGKLKERNYTFAYLSSYPVK